MSKQKLTIIGRYDGTEYLFNQYGVLVRATDGQQTALPDTAQVRAELRELGSARPASGQDDADLARLIAEISRAFRLADAGPVAEFVSKPPHRTLGLTVLHPEGDAPTALFADLDSAGWEQNPALPPINGTKEVWFTKPGTGLFGGWTREEGPAFKAEAKAILARHGLDDVPHFELNAADLI
jgi:hypothetical protein